MSGWGLRILNGTSPWRSPLGSFLLHPRPGLIRLRALATTMSDEVSPIVKPPGEEEPKAEYPWRKAKKVACLVSFSGKNYYGMQRNPSCPTIEEELLRAFRDAGAIPSEWYDNMQKSFFQRASRTDKGVSAIKMIISLKMLHEDDTLTKVNVELPPAIRLQGVKRVTKNFNSKVSCDARTYLYLMPTFAVCPLEQTVTEQYRIDEDTRSQMNKILGLFVGSHYYHNYTAGKLPMEPSSLRFITEFEAGEPFEQNGLEFVVIKVKGQSFMLHQIRKMIGMMISVMRGYTTEATIEATWAKDRIDIPRAPGLGLMLNEVHYERYNKRFGSDGIHEALTWDELQDDLESFKKDVIFADIIQTEKEERSMLDWMENLPIHSFEPRHFESVVSPKNPLRQARGLVGKLNDKDAEEDEQLQKEQNGAGHDADDVVEEVKTDPKEKEKCEVAEIKA